MSWKNVLSIAAASAFLGVPLQTVAHNDDHQHAQKKAELADRKPSVGTELATLPVLV